VPPSTAHSCIAHASVSSRPKANTKFLSNILRHTGNHNSALLAKEAQESKLRLDRLRQPSSHHRPTQHFYSARSTHESNRDRSSRRDTSPHHKSSRHHHSSRRSRHRSASPDRDSTRRTLVKSTTSDRQSTHRSKRSRHSPSPHPSDSTHRSKRSRHSPSPHLSDSTHRSKRKRLSPSPHPSDSDPLDAIIGPAPPPSNPPLRSRGRGTQSHASTIDHHFSETYDPSADVQPDPQQDDDALDWDQALEAFRDRQKWKLQGAERLRAAGFSERDVSKWETGAEKSQDDVVWAKKGEGREWDRGKLVDEDGIVDVKPEWARLKNT
jgi:hypothetical protein